MVQSGLTVPHFPKSMIKRPTPGFPELPVKNVLRNEVKVKLKNIQVIDKNQLVILPPISRRCPKSPTSRVNRKGSPDIPYYQQNPRPLLNLVITSCGHSSKRGIKRFIGGFDGQLPNSANPVPQQKGNWIVVKWSSNDRNHSGIIL